MIERYVSEGRHLRHYSSPTVGFLSFDLWNGSLVGAFKGNNIMGWTLPETDNYNNFVIEMDRLFPKFVERLSGHIFYNIIIPSLND